jgi:hypothetical protein
MAEQNDVPVRREKPISEAEINAKLAWIDGVNGSAGQTLEDPYLRGLLRQSIAGEITSEQYRELGMEHLRKQMPA